VDIVYPYCIHMLLGLEEDNVFLLWLIWSKPYLKYGYISKLSVNVEGP
jgi:hypothetical protein